MSKRILVITPRLPYPPVGGDRLRILSLCKILASKYDLTLASLCANSEEMHSAKRTDVFVAEHRVLQSPSNSLFQTLKYIPTQKPLQNGYFFNSRFAHLIDGMLSSHDLILAHLIRGGQYVLNRGNIPAVLEMTDAISMNYARVRAQRHSRSLRSQIFSYERKRLLPYEINLVNNFEYTSLVSDVDKGWLVEHGAQGSKIGVHTLAIDTDILSYSDSRSGSDIAFIGNLTTLQNADACLEFARRVLPLIHERRNLRFLVVGHCADGLRKKLNRIKGVYATGRVDCVQSVLHEAFCGVCFMRIGAGIQTKILEYMSLGLPSVVTSQAFEGLSAIPGRDIVVKDDARAFADAVVDLYDGADKRKTIAASAYQYLVSNHSYAAVQKPFLKAVDRLVSSCGSPQII